MKITVQSTSPNKQSQSCLIIGILEEGPLSPIAKEIDRAANGFISQLIKQKSFEAKTGQTFALFQPGGAPFAQVILVGCGKQQALTLPVFRKIANSAIKAAIHLKCKQAVCYLSEMEVGGTALPWKIKQIAEAAGDAIYRFDPYKSTKEPAAVLQQLIIYNPNPKEQGACDKALAQAKAINLGVAWTKNLANTPSNICTPRYLAQQAKSLTKQYRNVKVNILDEAEMRRLGMGALLGVAQGSAEEAQLICVEYKGGKAKQAPVALVGKGITFDTGGNSLKSPDNMVGMKYDMCGAATVLGTIQAVAELQLPINVIGVIPAVENMPGGRAYKPEDILTSLSGQTIEVISTDAEGRLILCDALTYCEKYKPEIVIDIATLTGAVVIALGTHATTVLGNDATLTQNLLVAGKQSNDRVWELPLWEEYQEQIKSPFADMSNSGGRTAGTITAACFLSRFTKQYRWAHLDVAGTAANMFGNQERMATGRPVPLLTQYLINRSHND